ncbi:MAG: helix-turn-helix transcriptional regulator, partial [Halobacteriaceae archaeon]
SEVFNSLASDYTDGESVGPTPTPFKALAQRASERTNRSMEIQDIQRSTSVVNGSNGTGLLVLKFQWTNFARVENGTLHVGDVFGSPWNLAKNQRLIIQPPTGYSVNSVQPSTAVNDGVLEWTGPQSFAQYEPSVTYVPGDSTPPTTTTTPSPPVNEEQMNLGDIFLFIIALFIGGLIAYAWTRRDSIQDIMSSEEEEEKVGDDHASSRKGGDEEKVDEEDLLSDEEKIERMLRKQGGRMRQAEIVEQTGWSNAKVSQLLSDMDDADQVDKLRIGRENLITLVEESEENEEPGSQ